MPAPVINIDPEDPASKVIEEAASFIKEGGVVCYPTRSLYGLGADAFNANAVDRIFAIKKRSQQKPILVLINHPGQLTQLVRRVPSSAVKLMQRFWPGWLTIVFEARDTLPDNLTAGSGKIGVRLAGHAVALALTEEVQSPITGTSANLSGRPGCHRVDNLEPQIIRQVDLVLDAGALKGGKGSTVVDVCNGNPRILREGELTAQEISTILGS
ncbi:MAG: L-threonylcarbamoyladenylate synthase [Desulfobacterales bacterium]|jgi:L-threonylcarbamoyladenylate synthase